MPKVTKALTALSLLVAIAAALLHTLSSTPLEVLDPNSTRALKEGITRRPHDGAIHANLALALLRPSDELAPNGDETSLYGADYTLYHPNTAESRREMEKALKLAPNLAAAHLAHQAVLMAEGNGEDAIQPGRRAIELMPNDAESYWALARSHLLAGCAQGCRARMSLREDKKQEKKDGRRTALAQREVNEH